VDAARVGTYHHDMATETVLMISIRMNFAQQALLPCQNNLLGMEAVVVESSSCRK